MRLSSLPSSPYVGACRRNRGRRPAQWRTRSTNPPSARKSYTSKEARLTSEASTRDLGDNEKQKDGHRENLKATLMLCRSSTMLRRCGGAKNCRGTPLGHHQLFHDSSNRTPAVSINATSYNRGNACRFVMKQLLLEHPSYQAPYHLSGPSKAKNTNARTKYTTKVLTNMAPRERIILDLRKGVEERLKIV